jgi:LacI family transcriptional regulator
VNTVDVDSRSGIYAAVEYLVRLGHSRLLFLGFDDRQSWVEERRRAFREIAALLRVPHVAESALPRPVERREKDPRRTLSGATGVVAVNDDAAVWLLNAAARAGLAVPRDVSVVGFDDDPQFRHLELTTVHVDMEQLGCEAGRLLGRLAAAPFSTAISHLQFPAELVVRHTTGPAPKRRG